MAPHFAHGTYEGVLDLFWPVRARGAFYGPYRHAEDAPSALVLHTTHDLELPPPGARCDQAPVSPSSKKSSSIARSSSAAAWMR